MRAVWKFSPTLDMAPQAVPEGAQWLDAQWQDSEFGQGLFAWALVDPDAPRHDVVLFAVGTGHWLPSRDDAALTHVGSAQVPDGIVLHVFTGMA